MCWLLIRQLFHVLVVDTSVVPCVTGGVCGRERAALRGPAACPSLARPRVQEPARPGTPPGGGNRHQPTFQTGRGSLSIIFIIEHAIYVTYQILHFSFAYGV